MRWFWIDRFEEFARCRRAVAVKCVSLAEEHLHDHFPGVALMPNSLVLEGMAQTAGLLVADAIDFGRQVVLAKVAGCEFEGDPIPGDVIRFEVEIQELTPEAAFVRATTTISGAPHGTADLTFGLLKAGTVVPQIFSREEMMRWLDQLHLYDVAEDVDGSPIRRDRLVDVDFGG
jgi:3-hydroxyacyl-[acyl-carrier-protein] dehydratase